MSSSFQAWDYSSLFLSDVSKHPLFFISFFDASVEHIFITLLKSSKADHDFKALSARDITRDWVDDNLVNLDLFAEPKKFLVISGHEMDIEVLKSLNTYMEDSIHQIVITGIAVKKDLTEFLNVTITPPRFWEMNQYFQFLTQSYSMGFSFQAKEYFLSKIEQDPYVMSTELLRLKVLFNQSGREIGIKDLEFELKGATINHFDVAKLISRKKFREFLVEMKSIIAKPEIDFEELRMLAAFLQGHLIKISDPRYVQEKARPTKYDNEIVEISKIWTKEELIPWIDFCSELEVLAKSKNSRIKEHIKQKHLNYVL